ncbi:hypothetical protein NL312_29890, partial [Klebsiella pneumoniae]|nr:hypothetical protein [Klebsiella pneumoniae]
KDIPLESVYSAIDVLYAYANRHTKGKSAKRRQKRYRRITDKLASRLYELEDVIAEILDDTDFIVQDDEDNDDDDGSSGSRPLPSLVQQHP